MHDALPGPILTLGAARTWKNAKSLPLRRCQSGWFIMTSYSASRCSPGSCAPWEALAFQTACWAFAGCVPSAAPHA